MTRCLVRGLNQGPSATSSRRSGWWCRGEQVGELCGIKTVWMPGPWESRQAEQVTVSDPSQSPYPSALFFPRPFLVRFPAFSGVFVGLLFHISRVTSSL